MKIIFRVDASNRMGTGHLIRCLTLAKALHERGEHIRFICRAHPGHLIELLQRQEMPVTVLPEFEQPIREEHTDVYATFLGVTQDKDAEQTIEVLHRDRPDWLIVDHYGLDVNWEKRLRPHIVSLMVIDDLANRHHDCDLLLDQNSIDGNEGRYKNLVPETCLFLIGPRFALLKQEYAIYRKDLSVRNGEVRRVLVFFGGSDRGNMTSLALEALSVPEFSHMNVDVVVGANNQQHRLLEQQACARPLTNLYGLRSHLADLMAQADLFIGAGGATTWERMCLGLPSLVIALSENQLHACEALSSAGLIQYVGVAANISVNDLKAKLSEMLDSPSRLKSQSTESQAFVDGRGVARVIEIMWPSAKSDLHLRLAREEDAMSYFAWVNDQEVRASAINSGVVSLETHLQWYKRRMCDSDTFMFILEAKGLPVGQVRFEIDRDEAVIDYSLDSLARGRGWANELIRLGVLMIHRTCPVIMKAVVKSDNLASSAVFLRLGFAEEIPSGGNRYFRLSSSRIAQAGLTYG